MLRGLCLVSDGVMFRFLRFFFTLEKTAGRQEEEEREVSVRHSRNLRNLNTSHKRNLTILEIPKYPRCNEVFAY